MKKRLLHRFTLAMSLIMSAFFGFPGLALADASISNTGPDSYNKIEFNNKNECDVENNNDVDVKNVNLQSAHTGDAVVGSQWGKYAPEAWQARGASYEEWRSAVNDYMASYEWGGHGGGNTVGGDATSGDATNVNNTSTDVSIDNSGACARVVCCDENGKPVKPGQKPTHDENGRVLSASEAAARAAGGAGVLGAGGVGGVGGQGGVGGAFSPTTSGGVGGGPGVHPGHDDDCDCAGDVGIIDTTGPDSYNKISFEDKNYTSVENNNNVGVVNFSVQKASTGDATVAGNTYGGSGGSGDSANANGTGTGAGIAN